MILPLPLHSFRTLFHELPPFSTLSEIHRSLTLTGSTISACKHARILPIFYKASLDLESPSKCYLVILFSYSSFLKRHLLSCLHALLPLFSSYLPVASMPLLCSFLELASIKVPSLDLTFSHSSPSLPSFLSFKGFNYNFI